MENKAIPSYNFNNKDYTTTQELFTAMNSDWDEALDHINANILENTLSQYEDKSVYNEFIRAKTAFYEEVPKILHIREVMLAPKIDVANKSITAFINNQDASIELLDWLITLGGLSVVKYNKEAISQTCEEYAPLVADYLNNYKKAILARRKNLHISLTKFFSKPRVIGYDLAAETDDSEFDNATKTAAIPVETKLIEYAQLSFNGSIEDRVTTFLDTAFKLYGVFKNPFFRINEEYRVAARDLHLFYFLNSQLENQVFSYKDIRANDINELAEYLQANPPVYTSKKYQFLDLFVACYTALNTNIPRDLQLNILTFWAHSSSCTNFIKNFINAAINGATETDFEEEGSYATVTELDTSSQETTKPELQNDVNPEAETNVETEEDIAQADTSNEIEKRQETQTAKQETTKKKYFFDRLKNMFK